MIKNCITYSLLTSLFFYQWAYPVSLFAQNQVIIQNQSTDNPPSSEPSLAGSGIIQLPDLGDSSSGSLSAYDEKKLGERIIREVRKDPDYSNNWLIYDYLNELGQSLVASARKQKISGADASGPFAPTFEFFAVRDKSINAFALPGGYIGVHTGLLMLSENESELASVLGHEIGHVTQKHIARGASLGKDSSILMLAAMLVAALAVKSNPNAAQGLAVGGQALAIQNQLSYSRDAEREADRIGFQILQADGFAVGGMPAFFQKMQKATSISDSGVPAYIRTHPLTVERAADMQNRVRENMGGKPNKTLDFYLVQVLAKLEQQGGPTEIVDTKNYFESLLNSPNIIKNMQGQFGLGMIAIMEKNANLAENFIKKSQDLAHQIEMQNEQLKKSNYIFDNTLIQIAMLRKNFNQALIASQSLLKTYPNSRAVEVGYIETLIEAGKNKEAILWLEAKTKNERDNPIWWNYLAKVYSKENKTTLYHMAIAEQYALEGALPAAIQQLKIAKDESDNNFYQLSELEARKRQFELLYKEELIDAGKLERKP